MRTFIYDLEVFAYDWVAVFRDPEEPHHTVIHNDNYVLREFLSQPDYILGGFNNKQYDNYVLMVMIRGGSEIEVKKANDWIISGKPGWEIPFIQGMRRPFKAFDLRDDVADPGLSLKAVEGNLGLPIVESSVPFDLDRPLTAEELDEVIRYCKHDVDATVQLYKVRKEDYIDAKALVAEMYHIPVKDALELTNAKLSAKVLGAKYTERSDERNYIIPDNIDAELIPPVILDFFLQIRDPTIPETKLFGAGKGSKGMTLDVIFRTAVGDCPTTYAWGGVHGAKPCVTIEAMEQRPIVNQDVGSLYPNSMINFGYCSRSMADPDAYVALVQKRLGYKHAGDKIRANALKLVVNTVYGAMLNLYNDLADRWAGRSVCISNQLAMTMLIVMLMRQCRTIDFVNINTDGIMYTIDRSELEVAEAIVATWCEITRFEMERDDFDTVIQKDVNNYIGIKADGSVKTKGSYVKLYKGGTFKSNSLQIIHKAIVDYLVDGISPEETIRNEKDILKFQQIVKTGGTYEGAYHIIDGKRVAIQKVNRIYAVKDTRYGQITKGKWVTEKRRKDKATGRMISTSIDPPIWSESTIPECPKHAFCDNTNVLSVDDLDKKYYIDMAWRRIDKYLNIDKKTENKIAKIKEVIEIMPTTKKETAALDVKTLNIWQKLSAARVNFLNAPVKKSGINRFAQFKYFELEDIVPTATKIFHELGLLLMESITYERAEAVLLNVDKPEETIVFQVPAKDCAIEDGTKMSAIQGLGAYVTYLRRYLYCLVLDIVEADPVDGSAGKPDADRGETVQTKKGAPATAEQRKEMKEELTSKDGKATDVQVKSIKNGLKKLREKGNQYEDYVTDVVMTLKKGMTKTEADNVLITIGDKIAE